MRLSGKVAVVTGAASGIGEAISRLFSAEGVAVAVTDAREEAAERVAGSLQRARAWRVDVTDRRQVEDAASGVERELGPIDIWVNNAGISKIVPFLDCTEELWERMLQVNLTGTFLGCQAAVRRMHGRGRGAIINMSSQSGKVGTSQYAAYCASKFAVIGLTQSLALEFARSGIRVNALCPGIVLTPLWDTQLADYARKHDLKLEEVRPSLEQRIPLGRLCTVEDVAQAAVFLASDESSYLTGQSINISGGSVLS